MNNFNLVSTLDRAQYTINESIVVPVTNFLRKEGVDLARRSEVVDLFMTSDNNPAAVSGIEVIQDETLKSIMVNDSDVVIVSLGSMSFGTITGSNDLPPSPLLHDEIKIGDWSLWIKLSQRSVQFGEPLAFSTKINETRLESFTITFQNSTFLDLYQRLTDDYPGSGRLVSLVDSSWMLSISLPQCPLFPGQPKNVNVVWGYSLYPERDGDFVCKPMLDCSGEEILLELLQHLQFPHDPILPDAITIPMIQPLATSSSINQLPCDRPLVAPAITTNLAFVGPFTEFPWKMTCSVENSVRSAQYAVYQMMGIGERPIPANKNCLFSVWGMMR
jgi:oleate hydratase